ncbi:LytTR family two component transcriptional regulator [Arcicella aurantiaca]|uniref:LytTR family two component transcriptional regulator n=1 Tax=Arcicella aurantiaca TaxID=591202 RepID=A0A316EBJ7_9BACT|nr:LytTR family DNA-binding domain-containing protein [Arcicella aurantiaca]PWK27054.1 LytTR family two component transcriptional regulator [Arcicella aurantiaca]
MKINCLVVEDEPLARNLMTAYIEKIPYLNLLQACSNPLEAIDFLRENTVDLLFLDVQMPEITGITLLKILQKKPLVILTTAYSEYALEGYEHDVMDYLLKPITFERFLKAVEKAHARLSNVTSNTIIQEKVVSPPDGVQPFIFVKDGTKLVKIKLNDILYVEGLKDYVTIHTRTQKVVTLQRLKTLEEELPENKFIRIHNSFIVAFEAIEAIEKEKVQISSVFIPISDTYRKTFKEFIDASNLSK